MYIYRYDINLCICVYANIAYKNILTNKCNVHKKNIHINKRM